MGRLLYFSLGIQITDHSIKIFHKVIVLLEYFDLFISHISILHLPIMLALCQMLVCTNYAKHYAGIMGLDLTNTHLAKRRCRITGLLEQPFALNLNNGNIFTCKTSSVGEVTL